jgi:hypothetical protein
MTPMLATGPFERLHLVGFLTGALLYGMLLVMVTRPPVRPDAFAFSTGLFGAFSIAEPLLIDVVDGRLQPRHDAIADTVGRHRAGVSDLPPGGEPVRR